MSKRRAIRWAFPVFAGALALGQLAAPTTADAAGREVRLAWPAENPQIALEAVVELDRLKGRGATRLLDRLVGREARTSGIQRPYGLAWDGADLLVTDPGGGRLVRISVKGRLAGWIGAPLETPIGVASCRTGVAITDSRGGRVGVVDRGLRAVRWLAEGLVRPTGVVCRADRLFVVETGRHRIVELDLATGHVLRFLGGRGDGDGEFNFPTTIGLAEGSFWVGDTLNFRLQQFDTQSGAFRRDFGRLGDAAGEMPRLKGVAVDSRGRLWVSDAYLDQISLYSSDGSFLMALGGSGNLPGEFSFPAGIAAHGDGRVAVVDSFNRRIQIFRGMNDD